MQAWRDVTSVDAPPQLPGWSVVRVIGRGRGGDLLLVRSEADPDTFDLVRLMPPDMAGVHDIARAAVDVPAISHLVPARDVVATSGPAGVVGVTVDLIEAGSLQTLSDARGVLTVGEVVTALAPVCEALHRLHLAGAAHGSVDAHHVLLDPVGRPHLSDLAGAWARRLLGAAVGPGPARPADDVYGVGACAWRLLTGGDLGRAATAWPRPQLREVVPSVPKELAALVGAALSADEGRRPSARALTDGLYACADPEPLPLPDGEGPGAAVTRRIPERFTRGAAPVVRNSAPPLPPAGGDGGALRTRRWIRPRTRHLRGGS